ncbi:hypothetical protein D4764_11G0006030 [Takifugu flavidus]|uniref:RabBD domain-containing protein n=1 Tax=Takifugu flavidus TaxID=433684 RepID=A0A5C6PFI3_9TELE|nr:hypothetical protein D4764_11G0006030 [Takifugu flavidus]
MFASVGPRGGPRPPVAPTIPEPDLSHLTEDERKIIMAVLARQREEEAKDEAMLKTHQLPCPSKGTTRFTFRLQIPVRDSAESKLLLWK